MQSTVIITCYGALHLEQTAYNSATNIKVLCTNATIPCFWVIAKILSEKGVLKFPERLAVLTYDLYLLTYVLHQLTYLF